MEEATLKTHKMEFSLLQYNLCEKNGNIRVSFKGSLKGICRVQPRNTQTWAKISLGIGRGAGQGICDVKRRNDAFRLRLVKFRKGITPPPPRQNQTCRKIKQKKHGNVSITGTLEIHDSINGKRQSKKKKKHKSFIWSYMFATFSRFTMSSQPRNIHLWHLHGKVGIVHHYSHGTSCRNSWSQLVPWNPEVSKSTRLKKQLHFLCLFVGGGF